MSIETTVFAEDDIILSAELRETAPMLPGFPSGQNDVVITVAGKRPAALFSYYVDELTFEASEFGGLTCRQARDLFRERDVAYLRAP